MSISINSYSAEMLFAQSSNSVPKQSSEDSEALNEVDRLREQMIALENELLQIQSSEVEVGNTSGETKEELEKQLEDIKQQLKTAESKAASSTNATTASSVTQNPKPKVDKYVKGNENSESPGIYTVKLNGGKGYNISFKPFSDGKDKNINSSDEEKKAEDKEEDEDKDEKEVKETEK